MIQNKIDSQPLLEVFLLGKFQVKIDGSTVDEKAWSRRSAKALVKLLALKPFHSFHREQIMDLLWAEELPETTVNNLNKAIHGARRALEPELAKGSHSRFILTQNNQISLASPGSLVVDLDEFERLANIAINKNDLESAQKAFGLYRGDLLTEDIYEDWIYTRRESMRILFRKMATKTAEIHAHKNNQTKSIEILQKLIASDGTDEYVHRLLMRFYAETGSKYQALKQFEHCRAALQSLGIEPEAETVKLEQGIRRGEILPAQKEYRSGSTTTNSSPVIKPLTFQNGVINSANFLPDGKTVVLSAAWEGGISELYSIQLKTGEINTLEIKDASVFAISSAGQKAIALNPKRYIFVNRSTLSKLSQADEKPIKLSENVQEADWHPLIQVRSESSDTDSLAVVRDNEEKNCLEFPIGNTIYETSGWISHPRFSPDGNKIAFIEHPLLHDDAGCVVVLDLQKKNRRKQILSNDWVSIMGLAWRGDEIWFSATHEGTIRNLHAVNLQGDERQIYRGMGNLTVRDISKNGDVLVTVDKTNLHTIARHANENIERDVSWHDLILVRDLTDDGEKLFFEEAGVSGGNFFSAYMRDIKNSSIKKIGDGSAVTLSPDNKWALLRMNRIFDRLMLVSLETGETKSIENDPSNPLIYQPWASFFPDGKRIIFSANEIDRRRGIYIQNIDGGKPVRFTVDEGIECLSSKSVSPNGEFVILTDNRHGLTLYRTIDGFSAPLKNLEKADLFIRWADDNENLFIWRRGDLPLVTYKYNLASGTKEKWLEIMPKDDKSITQIMGVKLTPDGRAYSYSFSRESSDLYLMKGF